MVSAARHLTDIWPLNRFRPTFARSATSTFLQLDFFVLLIAAASPAAAQQILDGSKNDFGHENEYGENGDIYYETAKKIVLVGGINVGPVAEKAVVVMCVAPAQEFPCLAETDRRGDGEKRHDGPKAAFTTAHHNVI